MDEKQRQHFANLIKQHLEQIQNDIVSLKELSKPVAPDNAIGRLSRMEAIAERSIHQTNLRKAQNRLVLLEQASKRVLTEGYGLCAKCEDPIPEKRLEILPETLACMDCLTKKED